MTPGMRAELDTRESGALGEFGGGGRPCIFRKSLPREAFFDRPIEHRVVSPGEHLQRVLANAGREGTIRGGEHVPPASFASKKSRGHEHGCRDVPVRQCVEAGGDRADVCVVERNDRSWPFSLRLPKELAQRDDVVALDQHVEMVFEVPFVDVEAEVSPWCLTSRNDVVIREDHRARCIESVPRGRQSGSYGDSLSEPFPSDSHGGWQTP
jgi:hypothetical protein